MKKMQIAILAAIVTSAVAQNQPARAPTPVRVLTRTGSSVRGTWPVSQDPMANRFQRLPRGC